MPKHIFTPHGARPAGYEALRSAVSAGYNGPNSRALSARLKQKRLLVLASMAVERDLTPMFEHWGVDIAESGVAYDRSADWVWSGTPSLLLEGGFEKVRPRNARLDNYGLYSNGLYINGLHSNGLYSNSLYS